MYCSEEYWSNEGNNKRMRLYRKISKGLKIFSYVLKIVLAIYVLILCTNSLLCLFNIISDNELNFLRSINFRNLIYNTYKITFIIILLVTLYYGYKRNCSIGKLISNLIKSIIFLPISVLLIYNFLMLGNLMNSFYLLVIFVVMEWVINSFIARIDKLYGIAVGSIEVNKNRKGDKKICKGK